MKRKLIGLLSLVVMMMFATSVFAAQQVEVKVTSEPIAEHATCEKAGGYTLEFDAGTSINDGDQLTIDLPLNVTLCNDIDIMIPWSSAVGAVGDTAAAYATEDDSSTSATLTSGDVEFYLTGDAGSQRVTINVVATAGLTVGTDTGDMFTIKFFDQNLDGVFIEGAVPGVYDAAAKVADNTRCINVSAYDNETVSDSLDSAGDFYTFIPSNPQVAHVVTATGYSLYSCVKASLNKIMLGTVQPEVQDGPDAVETCTYFDFESGHGYCSSDSLHPNYLIIAATKDMAITDYIVSLEIMTDGVYFSNDAVVLNSFANGSVACADGTPLGTEVSLSGGQVTYTNSDGAVKAPYTGGATCTIPVVNQVVKLVSTSFALDASGAKALRVNVPALLYSLDEVSVGDEVQLKVVLTKAPCGDIIEETFSVGTFGCDNTTPGITRVMSFPYFTAITGDSYWDGFSVVNKSATAGTAVLTIYEADGDVFTASVAVAANSMQTMLTSSLLPIATQVSGTGTLGDARFYMEVSADFVLDGFAMMANPSTGESMGYLPRLGH